MGPLHTGLCRFWSLAPVPPIQRVLAAPGQLKKWELHKHMKTQFSVVRNLEWVTSPVRRGQVTEAGFWGHKAFASFQALPYTTVHCVEAELEDTGLLYKGRARQAGGKYCKRYSGPHRQQI